MKKLTGTNLIINRSLLSVIKEVQVKFDKEILLQVSKLDILPANSHYPETVQVMNRQGNLETFKYNHCHYGSDYDAAVVTYKGTVNGQTVRISIWKGADYEWRP